MSLYSIPPLLTSLLFFAAGVYIVFKRRALGNVFAYSLWCFTTSYWQACWTLLFSTSDPKIAKMIIHMGYAGIIFIPIALYDCITLVLRVPPAKRKIKLVYGIGALFLGTVWFDPLFLRGFYSFRWGFYPRAGLLHPIYLTFLMVLCISMYRALTVRKNTIDLSPTQRNQARYFRWALLFYIGAASDFTVNYGAGFYPLGFLFTWVSLGFSIFGIIKYQLFDIRIVIRQTLVYSFVSALLASLYGALAMASIFIFQGVYRSHALVIGIFIACVATALSHPLITRLQRWIDRRFPRESLDQSMLREATGTFVHEIKRPLANISLPAQLALQDVEAIQKGTHLSQDQLTKLVDRLQYIVSESIEAGHKIEAIRGLSSKSAPSLEPMDLKSVAQRALQQEESRIGRERIHLTTGIQEGPVPVMGDERQLDIAIGNVLKNAIDALSKCAAGQPRDLRVTLMAIQDTAVLTIEDSGSGISLADLPRLFEPWFSTKGSHGMGIGLYLTKEILKLHGATIEAKNRLPSGSYFRITFPAKGIA